MKVGGYKLSALEIESILLEVGFLLFFQFWYESVLCEPFVLELCQKKGKNNN